MDDRPFSGMTALVTGGARRLGRVLCMRLAVVGANVVVHYNRSDLQAVQLASELQAKGVEATIVQADLSDPAQAAALVERARKAAGGPLDFLVNNASSYPAQRLRDLTWDSLSESLRTNAWAPFELSRSFVAQARRSGGAIVNLLDTRIADYDWEHAGYILAKHTLAELTRMTAVEFAPEVRVNAVSPGPILPPPGGAEATLQRLARHLPLRRTPDPDDVADAVLYLLGARGVTGHTIQVDGGRHLGRAVYDGPGQPTAKPGGAATNSPDAEGVTRGEPANARGTARRAAPRAAAKPAPKDSSRARAGAVRAAR